MATIIDELVMRFGLDGSQFDAGAKKAKGNLKTLREDAGKTAKDMEDHGKRAARFFTEMQRAAIQFFGVLAGATGLTQMITQVIQLEAHLGRLADRTGQASEQLHAFGNVAALVGGNADEMQASMSALSQAMVNMKYKGEMSPTLVLFSQLGVRIAEANGQMRDQEDILLDLASVSERMSKQDFFNLAQSAGISPSMIEVVMKGRRELEKYLTEQRKNSLITKEQTDRSRKLTEQFGQLKQSGAAMSREFVSSITPAIETFFGFVKDGFTWMQDNQEMVQTIFIGIAGVIAAYFVPSLIAATIAAAPLIVLVGGLALAIGGLWQDYQVWKRGGESFINWGRWSRELNPAIKTIGDLINTIVNLGSKYNVLTRLKETFVAVFSVIGEQVSAAVAAIGGLAKVVDQLLQGDFAGAWQTFTSFKPLERLQRIGQPIVDYFKNAVENWGDQNDGRKPMPSSTGYRNLDAPRVPYAPAGQSAPINSTEAMAAAKAYFMSQGWTAAQAAGIVANLQAESAMKPTAVGDSGRAYGLAQWHPDRQANFKRQFGKDIRQSTMQEQLAFVQFELTQGNEQRAGRKLRQTTDAGQAAAVVSLFYERPADADGAARKRAMLATQIMGGSNVQQYMAGAQAQAAIGQPASRTNQTNVETNIGQLVIQTQATDAQGIAQQVPMALQRSLGGAVYQFDTGQD